MRHINIFFFKPSSFPPVFAQPPHLFAVFFSVPRFIVHPSLSQDDTWWRKSFRRRANDAGITPETASYQKPASYHSQHRTGHRLVPASTSNLLRSRLGNSRMLTITDTNTSTTKTAKHHNNRNSINNNARKKGKKKKKNHQRVTTKYRCHFDFYVHMYASTSRT